MLLLTLRCRFSLQKDFTSDTVVQVDVDKSGSIDYSEFLTAMINKHKLEKEEDLLRAFQHFDKDNSG